MKVKEILSWISILVAGHQEVRLNLCYTSRVVQIKQEVKVPLTQKAPKGGVSLTVRALVW